MKSCASTGSISARSRRTRIAMDPREQTPLAPFLGRRTRREAAAHHEALRFERVKRRGDSPARRRGRASTGRHRAETLRAAAHDFDQRVVRRPARALHAAPARRSADRARLGHGAPNAAAVRPRSRARRFPLASALRRLPPGRAAVRRRRGCASARLLRQLVQPVGPALSGVGLRIGQETEPDQRLVQFIGSRRRAMLRRGHARSPRGRARRCRKRTPDRASAGS